MSKQPKFNIESLLTELEAVRAFGIEHVHDDPKVSARDIPETEWLYWHRVEEVMPTLISYIRTIQSRNKTLETEGKQYEDIRQSLASDRATLEADWKRMRKALQEIEAAKTSDFENWRAMVEHFANKAEITLSSLQYPLKNA